MVRRQTRAQKRNRRQQNKSRRNNRRQNKSLRRKRQSRRKLRGRTRRGGLRPCDYPCFTSPHDPTGTHTFDGMGPCSTHPDNCR